MGASARPLAPLARKDFESRLDLESMRAIGSALGCGGLIAYGESTCLVRVASEFARFRWVELRAQSQEVKTTSREGLSGVSRTRPFSASRLP